MPACCVPSCQNNGCNTAGRDVSFHRLPANFDMQKIWINKCLLDDQINVKHARVCSDHFLNEDYDIHRLLGGALRNHLKRDVVPSQNLPTLKTEDEKDQQRDSQCLQLPESIIIKTEESSNSSEDVKIELLDSVKCEPISIDFDPADIHHDDFASCSEIINHDLKSEFKKESDVMYCETESVDSSVLPKTEEGDTSAKHNLVTNLKSQARDYHSILKLLLNQKSEFPKLKSNPPACIDCKLKFMKKAHLMLHIKQCHVKRRSEIVIRCDECSKVFQTETELTAHQKIHDDKTKSEDVDSTEASGSVNDPLTCVACNTSFNNARALREHIRKHAGEKPFVCESCNKSFVSKFLLKYHMTTHTRGKSLVCNVCGKPCVSGFALKCHKATHTITVVKPFVGGAIIWTNVLPITQQKVKM